MKPIDISNKRFGRWVALKKSATPGMWLCVCDCGVEKNVNKTSLMNNGTKSCGCLMRELNTVHGHAKKRNRTKTYSCWYSMIQRCTNPKHKQFRDYGGRGISVCDDWRIFEMFLSDMGEVPIGLTIDRIDNSKGYEKGNCRWSSRSDQQLNRRNNRILEIDGVSKPMTAWAAELGINLSTVRYRLRRGHSHKDSVFAPVLSRVVKRDPVITLA